MKNYLFPHKYRLFATIIFFITFLSLCVITQLDWQGPEFLHIKVFLPFYTDSMFSEITPFPWFKDNITNEILICISIVTGIIMCFSKEKVEDEMTMQLRKDALIMALYVNYGFLFIATIIGIFF